MRVSLRHLTRYAYHRPVSIAPHVVRLRPAPHTRTAIEGYSLRVDPKRHFLNWEQDPFGNFQARLVFLEPASSLEVEVDLLADLVAIDPFDFFLDSDAEKLPIRYQAGLRRDLHPYLEVLPLESHLAGLVETCRTCFARDGRRTMDVLVDINRHIQRLLRYDIRMEPGVFTPEKTLTLGHGSCRDFAWLSCQVLRHLGFAARFASGYSVQLKPDEKPVEGPAGVSEDVADLHAWTEVFLPGAGWVGLDATAFWRVKAISRSRVPPILAPLLRSRARSRGTSVATTISSTSHFRLACRSPAWPRHHAAPSPTPTRPGLA
ncbi:MAG: transglutaminase family protein [Polyangia bacterium]